MNFTYEPLLTEKQVEAIHGPLDVQQECGAEMNHPAILEIFKHGAAVGERISSKFYEPHRECHQIHRFLYSRGVLIKTFVKIDHQ